MTSSRSELEGQTHSRPDDTDVRYSVILSVRNAERTLGVVLECLHASNLTNHEIVIVDDASTDGTVALCESFGITPIRLAENVGPAAGRNLAIRHSRGDTIVFLDSDVYFTAEVLGTLISRLESDPALSGTGVLTSMTPLNAGFYPKYFAIQEYLWTRRLLIGHDDPAHSYICTRCGTLRRAVFDAMGGFNEAYRLPSTEDLEFSARMGDRYLIRFFEDITVQHHYPSRLTKIIERYHRNSCEIFQMPPIVRKKAAQPYRRDAMSRLCLAVAGLCFVASLLYFPIAGVAAGLLILSAVIQHEFLRTCYAREGLYFTIRSWVVYCALPVPVATGLLAGMIGKLKKTVG